MDRPEVGFRQRMFAWAIARFNTRYENFASKYKEELLGDVFGTVLEIGPGTGVNLRYLASHNVHWIGVEPNLFMKTYLLREANRLNMPVELRIGTADALPVADYVTPIWKRLGDGCNPNRDTLMELERTGFESVNHERITAPLPVVSPQIVGVATKAGEV